MKQINLEVKVEDANLILEALGNLPFVKVHELISSIHQQASAQMADQNNIAANGDAVKASPEQPTEE